MTIKVIRANPTVCEPEKPMTKTGRARGVLGQISSFWYSAFRSVVLSPPRWDKASGWLAEQMGSPSLKGQSSVMWQSKDQNIDRGYAYKKLGHERTWKAVTDFMFSEGSPQVLVCNSL